jgi:hypothetical protein
MDLFVLFGDGAIIRKKKNDGNFASPVCATRNDAVSCHFFFSGDTPSPIKKINSFLNSI